jgi:hypothetical protein
MNNEVGAICCFLSLSGPLTALGLADRAARLLGASYVLMDNLGARNMPSDQFEYDLFIQETRFHLSEAAFQAAWQEGAAMSFQQVVAFALD